METNEIRVDKCQKCGKVNALYSDDMNCRTKVNEFMFRLSCNDALIHEMNITCNNYYYFECNTSKNISFKIYDSSMNEYTNSMFILSDNGYNYWITTTLNVGKYYIQFVNNSDNITKI